MTKWSDFNKKKENEIIVIHAGSGRELPECIEYCSRSKSTLIELSTGSILENSTYSFPVIICPNVSIAILQTLSMLRAFGNKFKGCQITVEESHQSEKKTVAGTAIELAKYFGVPADAVKSIRNKDIQRNIIGIPEKYLPLHAYHKITIMDHGVEIKIETKVLGHDSYVNGINKLIDILKGCKLEHRTYNILDILNEQNKNSHM